MRILHVPHAYAPVCGGVETQIRRVSEYLLREGHEVQVLTTDVPSVEGYYMALRPVEAPRNGTLNGVPITRVPFGNRLTRFAWGVCEGLPPGCGGGRVKSAIHSYSNARLMNTLCHRIQAWRPHVVVALPHLVRNVEIVLQVRQSISFSLVMLPLLHEFDPDWPYTSVARALKMANAVIANTNWERERLIQRYGVPEAKIFVGGMGIDVGSSRPNKDTNNACYDDFTVTYLGRKSVAKGIPLLLEAMSAVWATQPEVKLVIAGAKTSDSRHIDNMVASLPLWQQRNIHSLDDISDEEKHAVLCRSSLLVLPSKVESFGGVILEAWAYKIPVVAIDLPMMRSVIDNGENGFLVAAAPAKIAKCILSALRNMDSLREMGEKGYKKAHENYSWPTIARRFLEAYNFAALTK